MRKKIRKIAIFQNLPPGGGKRALQELLFLLKKKYTVKEFTYNLRKPKNLFEFLKLIYFTLPKVNYKIANKINNNFDLAFINHDFYTKSPYLLRYLKIPSIYLCHESLREFYEDSKLFINSWKYKFINLLRLPLKYIDKQNICYADLILTNSSFSKKNLCKIYKKKEIEKIQLGVNTKKFFWKKKKRRRFFLGIGALAKFKGHDFIIETLSLLPREKRFPYCVVASGGRDEEYIRGLAKRKKVDLIVKKRVSDKELINLYNKAKFLLIGAYNEPFGLVALEAMACGLPVISVAEGGLKEIIINDFCGFTIGRRKEKFAKVINEALTRQFNEKKIKDYVIKKWQWKVSVKQLEEYFRRVCQ